LDDHYFDTIWNAEEEEGDETPHAYSVVCCNCSGNKPCWEDKEQK
jgi:hypothetical protein